MYIYIYTLHFNIDLMIYTIYKEVLKNTAGKKSYNSL